MTEERKDLEEENDKEEQKEQKAANEQIELNKEVVKYEQVEQIELAVQSGEVEPNDPGEPAEHKSHASQVWLGIAIGTILIVLLAFLLLIAPVGYFAIGLVQLIFIIPAIIYWRKNTGIVQGLLIIAAITFLLNAACFGLVMYSLS